MINCLKCGKYTRNPKFCSSSCSASYTNHENPKRKAVRAITNCVVCGKILSRQQLNCCSNKCRHIWKRRSKTEQWLSGQISGHANDNNNGTKQFVRAHMLEINNSQCSRCGFSGINPVTEKSILQIHHKDGDSSNTDIDNLEVLCPNCHAMTPQYMGLNRHRSTRINR